MSDKNIIIISALMVVLLGSLVYFQTQKAKQISPEEADEGIFHFAPNDSDMWEKLDMKEIENIFQIREEVEYSNFSTPGGEISLDYPSHWEKIDENDVEIIGEEEDKAEIVFLASYAYSINDSYNPVILTVSDIKNNISIENMVLEIKEDDAVLSVSKKEDHYLVQRSDYSDTYGQQIISKEKLFFEEEKLFYVSLAATEPLWDTMNENLRHILESIKVRDKL